MTLDELQQLIDRMYSRKDEARGVEGTFMRIRQRLPIPGMIFSRDVDKT